MKPFLSEDFLLSNETARQLYFDYAEMMPIFDYHCHLPVKEIREDRQFENLTRIWLEGDHYKWRAMRANGIDERFITGDADDFERFQVWARTVPYTLRNPLYHWTHMELKKPFGIEGMLLNAATARTIYDICSEKLQQKEFSARGLLRQARVKVVCTTDDPLNDLNAHLHLKEEAFETAVLPTFRPDKAVAVEKLEVFNTWVDGLEQLTGISIRSYDSFLEALKQRHDFFHQCGCRLADHGLEIPVAESYTLKEIESHFQSLRSGQALSPHQNGQFKSAVLQELCALNAQRDWTQQFHVGPLRNTNTRMWQQLGPDTGFDSMGDVALATPLATLMDRLEQKRLLARTIIYNINPKDNEVIATLTGSFQDGSIPGKIQFGSGWWFNDQKEGIQRQLNALSSMGLLSRFVGMLTDSRSFLSYSRHEYFRRILCDLLGRDMENGEIPNDRGLVGEMIRDICFRNAVNYFGIEVPS